MFYRFKSLDMRGADLLAPLSNFWPPDILSLEHICPGELVLVPLLCPFDVQEQYHFFKKSFLQQPEANQELETDPPDS